MEPLVSVFLAWLFVIQIFQGVLILKIKNRMDEQERTKNKFQIF